MSDAADRFMDRQGALARLLAEVPPFEPPAGMDERFAANLRKHAVTAGGTSPHALVFEPPASLQTTIQAEAARLHAAQAPRRDAVVAELAGGRPAADVLGAEPGAAAADWLRSQQANHPQPSTTPPRQRAWLGRHGLGWLGGGLAFGLAAGIVLHALFAGDPHGVTAEVARAPEAASVPSVVAQRAEQAAPAATLSPPLDAAENTLPQSRQPASEPRQQTAAPMSPMSTARAPTSQPAPAAARPARVAPAESPTAVAEAPVAVAAAPAPAAAPAASAPATVALSDQAMANVRAFRSAPAAPTATVTPSPVDATPIAGADAGRKTTNQGKVAQSAVAPAPSLLLPDERPRAPASAAAPLAQERDMSATDTGEGRRFARKMVRPGETLTIALTEPPDLIANTLILPPGTAITVRLADPASASAKAWVEQFTRALDARGTALRPGIARSDNVPAGSVRIELVRRQPDDHRPRDGGNPEAGAAQE